MIFVLLGRRNALCLARHNRTKSAKISHFQASSDLLLYLREEVAPLPFQITVRLLRIFS